MQQPQTRGQKVSRARLRRDSRRHPFVAALVEQGITVDAFARDLGYSRSTVQSWYTADENGRPIPREAAEAIQRKLGVPLTAWRRIVD
jgi:transposase